MPIEPGNLSLGVLAGGLIGTFAGHYLTKSRSAEENFNRAATEFICNFTNTIVALDDLKRADGTNAIRDILQADCVIHKNAIIRFKLLLSENERTEIEKEWNKYCYSEKVLYGPDPKDKPFIKYSLDCFYLSDNPDEDFKAKKQMALEGIDRLIAFAKTK